MNQLGKWAYVKLMILRHPSEVKDRWNDAWSLLLTDKEREEWYNMAQSIFDMGYEVGKEYERNFGGDKHE